MVVCISWTRVSRLTKCDLARYLEARIPSESYCKCPSEVYLRKKKWKRRMIMWVRCIFLSPPLRHLWEAKMQVPSKFHQRSFKTLGYIGSERAEQSDRKSEAMWGYICILRGPIDCNTMPLMKFRAGDHRKGRSLVVTTLTALIRDPT